MLLVLLTSMLVTLLFWRMLPAPLQTNDNSDYTRFYEPVARNLLAGHGLVTPDGSPALRYPPGYPLMLAGIFGLSQRLNIPEQTVLAAFILLCTGLAAMFVYLLARSVWGAVPALISALIWITYPFALWLAKQPTSETPFMVVLYAGIYLFWYALLRKNRAWAVYFLAGCLIGCAMLIRPIALGMVCVLGALFWFAGRELAGRLRLLLVTMLLLGNVVVIFPWEAWVYTTTGRLFLLSTGGAPDISYGLQFALPQGCRQSQEVTVSQDVMVLMQDIRSRFGGFLSDVALGDLVSFLIEAFRTCPLTVVKLFSMKIVRSWYGSECHRFETPIMLIQAVYLALILWGSRAAWKRGAIPQQLVIGVWLVVSYFWGMTVLAQSTLRYMVPGMGLLFVLVPGSLAHWWHFTNHIQPMQTVSASASMRHT
jgi:4-amino-4-deoxy-L-arabinose transferase-like glycosyltransferase